MANRTVPPSTGQQAAASPAWPIPCGPRAPALPVSRPGLNATPHNPIQCSAGGLRPAPDVDKAAGHTKKKKYTPEQVHQAAEKTVKEFALLCHKLYKLYQMYLEGLRAAALHADASMELRVVDKAPLTDKHVQAYMKKTQKQQAEWAAGYRRLFERMFTQTMVSTYSLQHVLSVAAADFGAADTQGDVEALKNSRKVLHRLNCNRGALHATMKAMLDELAQGYETILDVNPFTPTSSWFPNPFNWVRAGR